MPYASSQHHSHCSSMALISTMGCHFCIPSNLREDDDSQGPVALVANDQVRRRRNTSSAAVPMSKLVRGPSRTTTVNNNARTLVNNDEAEKIPSVIVTSPTLHTEVAARPSRPRPLPLGAELLNMYDRMANVSSSAPFWRQDPYHNSKVLVSHKPSDSFETWFARLQFHYTLEQLSYFTDGQLDFDRGAFRNWLDSWASYLADMNNLEIVIPEAPIANTRALSIDPILHNSNSRCDKDHYVYLLKITVVKRRYRIHYYSRGSDDGKCPSCSHGSREKACRWKASEILRLLSSAYGRVGVTLLPEDVRPQHVNLRNNEEYAALEQIEKESGIEDASKEEWRQQGYEV
ncbi:hypothetical protein HII31_10864 [Pseudocercospora fuligena]|uniref:Uncharacterized protein n=1 Tax=Pseudocercospora fuligena TaxID=685502 RepID=A0A8H6VH69_9PEZI|nr:hypothetical protein HII31_10864 [Pseudocercospora fuligena]